MMSACRHYVTDKPKHKHKWAHTCLRLRGSKWDEKSRWENFDIAVICCGAHLGASSADGWQMARCKAKRTTSAKLKSGRSTLRIRHVEHVRDTEEKCCEKVGEIGEKRRMDREADSRKWDNSWRCHNNVGLFNGFSLSLKPDRGKRQWRWEVEWKSS